jgi:hypothetical protein
MIALKGKTMAILFAVLLTFSMTASMMLIPNANAHTPAWSIPTYAYISAEPSIIGVGQTITIYLWLDPVYGAAGGTSAVLLTNGYTASAALTSNNYRFTNYALTITAPDGTKTTQTWPVVADPTSNVYYVWTPTAVGTYIFNFSYPGQVYGANGNGYAKSILMGDTYLPSSASTTVTVQQTPIPAAVTSEPLPTNYWTRPIYGENTNWYTISNNWLGSGMPPIAGYTSSTVYHGDSVGPLTAHVMWTLPIQSGGIVGGNEYAYYPGAGYFEGSCYIGRFSNPIIADGYLYFNEPSSFTGGAVGPFVCVNLQTGQIVWSSNAIHSVSFAYIYMLWNGEQHGVFPPIIVSTAGGGLTGYPSMWTLWDGFTGQQLFNVTNVPGFAPKTGQMVGGQPAAALTTATVPGPSSEMIKYVFMNCGTAKKPQWYLAQWNSSDLWQYDVNPYTFGGSLSPSVINASNGVLVSSSGIPQTTLGTTGTTPKGATVFIPYGSTITDNAFIPLNKTTVYPENLGARSTFDWNVSIPWLNTMPMAPTYPALGGTGALIPTFMQGTAIGDFAAGGTCPLTVVAANYGDCMLCRNGSLPMGFASVNAGIPANPYTLFLVNLNASVGAIGSILWMKTYNPPAGNLTVSIPAVDWQTRTFLEYYEETLQFVGFSLSTGAQLWGPTASMVAMQYYESGYGILGACAYGNYYCDNMGGVCYCYSDTTGKLLWTYGNGEPGGDNSTLSLSSVYGEYPTYVGPISGNGVVYLMTNEHTVTDPIYKGAEVRAINATTGKQIWVLSCYGSMATPALSDGYATFLNGYDMQIYTVGRGPSATTVTAAPAVTTFGDNVVIRGTVMDVSAGTKQTEQAADFPSGVPCASDAIMTQWMGYVYQQQAEPTNFTGVPVTLSVTDSNGNHYNIGTATTDEDGMYTLTWTPIIAGNFTVTATFAGTNAYWPSSAQTSFNVMSAPAATPAPTATPTSVANAYFVPAVTGLFVLIIIVAIVLALLMLRKRP